MPNERRFVLVILTLLLATAALAAEPQPAAPPTAPAAPGASAAVAPPAPAPTAGIADIPENQAELQAARDGTLVLEPPVAAEPAVDAARAARRAAIDAVLAEQDARVEALVARIAGATADDAVTLQKEIEREKAATGRRLLELQLQFATGDGDQARVQRLQAALAEWDAPAPVATPVERRLPDDTNR